MRRAPIVLTATVLGTAGVLLFKPLPVSGLTGSSTTADTGGTTGSAEPSTGSDPQPSASAGASASASSATGTSTASAKDGTYTGTAETIRYGTTQVKVVIAGGRITDVAVVQENSNDGRSVQISENAFPTLREEVLGKQTAAVDTVSGATYTSLQYEASLQSALDQAGFAAADGSTASTDLPQVQEGPGGGH